jgi:transcriptional regulator of arginine metabolism
MKEIAVMADLKDLLLHGSASTQETLRKKLQAKGYDIHQSKISRLLRKLDVVKSKNSEGDMVYGLAHDFAPPVVNATIRDLIVQIIANENTIVIKTSPGSASLIARMLDHKKCNILGTIAGDDTIFVAPLSVKDIKQCQDLICMYLSLK